MTFLLRITLNSEESARPRTFLFGPGDIIFGSDPKRVQVLLDGPHVCSVHLKLECQGGVAILTNLSHVDQALWNGQPFTKKLISSGDVVLVGGITILFERLAEGEELVKAGPAEQRTDSLKHVSIKSSLIRWAWICCGILFLAMLATWTVAQGYKRGRERDEMLAAQGVSDVAMSLVHARLLGQEPENHNWSDLDFVKHALQELLPSHDSPAHGLDPQGRFATCPYVLRMYASHDLSRFLLIAQPIRSSLLDLWEHRSIVIDSSSMEVHALRDLRPLNRVLAYANPLAGEHDEELARLLAAGSVISLSQIGQYEMRGSFFPPKGLALLSPKGETLVYNAPRYRRLGSCLLRQMNKQIGHPEHPLSSSPSLQRCFQLHGLVFYTSESELDALKLKDKLDRIVPNHPFLFGYLSFDPQNERITSHLVAATELQHHMNIELLKEGVWAEEMYEPTQKLIRLLESHAVRPIPNFKKDFEELFEEYLKHEKLLRVSEKTSDLQQVGNQNDQLLKNNGQFLTEIDSSR